MQTLSAKPAELEEKWYVVDAKDQILGRLATRIAAHIRGKHLPNFTPHVNMKIYVIVINASEIQLTGKKWDDKIYYRHTGWPGGIRSITARQLQDRKPGEIIRKAVKGMLPKNKLGSALLKNLRIEVGPEHRHAAQKPQPLDLHTRRKREEV